MSRSYKNRKNKSVMIVKDKSSRFGKRMASKAARRADDVANGRNFRKHYCSWNICEYRFIEPRYTAVKFRKKYYDENDKYFKMYRNDFKTWKEVYRGYLKYGRIK